MQLKHLARAVERPQGAGTADGVAREVVAFHLEGDQREGMPSPKMMGAKLNSAVVQHHAFVESVLEVAKFGEGANRLTPIRMGVDERKQARLGEFKFEVFDGPMGAAKFFAGPFAGFVGPAFKQADDGKFGGGGIL